MTVILQRMFQNHNEVTSNLLRILLCHLPENEHSICQAVGLASLVKLLMEAFKRLNQYFVKSLGNHVEDYIAFFL